MHDRRSPVPRLLAVAHGTASPAGSSTIHRLIAAVAGRRPGVPVDLCFLDVIEPRLPAALAATPGPTVVVPVLLSTGYHVQADIPAAVAGRPDVAVARHLGPHPLLVDALVDRLGEVGDGSAVSTVLVGAGSSRSQARAELDETAAQLAGRRGREVRVLTMADDLAPALAALPKPVEVATYLLAEGQFVATLRGAAGPAITVAAPIGAHPALIELVWQRYDEVVDRARQ